MRGRHTRISEGPVRFLSDRCWSSERSTRRSAGGKRRRGAVDETTFVMARTESAAGRTAASDPEQRDDKHLVAWVVVIDSTSATRTASRESSELLISVTLNKHHQPAGRLGQPTLRGCPARTSAHSSTTWTAERSTAQPPSKCSGRTRIRVASLKCALVRSHGSDAGALARREGARAALCLVAEQGVAEGGAGEDSNQAVPGLGLALRFARP